MPRFILTCRLPAIVYRFPLNALLFRSEGLRAVVVDSDHKLHLQALTIGRDYGVSLWKFFRGLRGADWIVLNPADSLEEGQYVNVKNLLQRLQALHRQPARRRMEPNPQPARRLVIPTPQGSGSSGKV